MRSVAIVLAACCVALCVAVPCKDMHEKGLKLQRQGLVGGMIYQCEKDGSFKAMQCHASTGFCFCVDRNGTVVKNATRVLKGCDCHREAYTVMQKHLIGSYAPQCEADGTYSTRQCHASTGQCWCASPEGKAISNGTFGLVSCDCFSQKYEAVKKGLLGSFIPQCDKDGSFSKMQFDEGYLWCVTSEGEQITNKTRGLKSCNCPLHSYTAIHRGLLGSYRPLCDVDGYYTAMQCHEHHCWCARKDGTRLDVEAKSLAVCTCYRQADELMSTGLVGILPDCI